MTSELRCECGWSVTGTDVDELVTSARGHARRKHQMDVPATLLRRRAREAVQGESTVFIGTSVGTEDER